MPIYQNPKTGEEYELDSDYDVETGVDRNREKALKKGYKPIQEVVNPKTKQFYSIPEQDLDKAIAKGYQIPELAQAKEAAKPIKGAGIEKFGEVTPTEAALRGVTSNVPFLDEASGALKSPTGAIKKAVEYFGGKQADLTDPAVQKYIEERDLQRKRSEIASEEFPAAYYGGAITSGAGLGRIPMPASTASKLGAGVASGAVAGAGAAQGANIAEDVEEIAVGGAIGAIPGAAELASRGVAQGLKTVVGPSGERFVGNQALVQQAKDPSLIPSLKDRLLNQATAAKQQIAEDIKGLKESAGQKYQSLREKLLQSDVDVNIQPANYMDNVFASARRDRNMTAQGKEVLENIKQNLNVGQKRGMLVDELGNSYVNPDLSAGESLSAVIQAKQDLGNQIAALTRMQKAGTLPLAEQRSLEVLKNTQTRLDDIINQSAEQLSPELRTLYNEANKEYRQLKNMSGTAKSVLGEKAINQNKTFLNEQKLRRALEGGSEDLKSQLMQNITPSAKGKVEAAGKTIETIKNVKQSKDDWNAIKQINPLEGIPLVRNINVANTIQAYNKLNPALKKAVKALELSGKPITIQMINGLAAQHGVAPEDIEAALGPK